MPNLSEMLAGRRLDFSSARFEAELDKIVATGSASAIGKLCEDIFWCDSPERQTYIARRLMAPGPLQRVVRDGDAKAIGRVAEASFFGEAADGDTRIPDALTAEVPLGRVVANGDARAIGWVAGVAVRSSPEQRRSAAAALTSDGPLKKVISKGDSGALGYLAGLVPHLALPEQRTVVADALCEEAPLARGATGTAKTINNMASVACRFGSPGQRHRVMDVLTARAPLARVAASSHSTVIANLADNAARHARPERRTSILDALTAAAPLGMVAANGRASSIATLARAACLYATPNQRTRVVDALSADAPLARVAADGTPVDIAILRRAADLYGSPEHSARVTRVLGGAVLVNAVASVHTNADIPLSDAGRATWSAAAAGAADAVDIANLATLVQRMSQDDVALRGGARIVATRMMPTLQALGARQELIGQAAGYANARGLCVNLPEAVWSELAAAVPLLDALAATPLNPHECVRSAGVLSARQNVDRIAAEAGASLRLDGETRLVGPRVEIEYGGLVLAGVNEILPAVQRLPGVARQGEVAYIGTLEGEPMDRLPGVAAEAAAAAITAMEPANAARYLLDSTYGPVWQARLQGAFPELYEQVTARADAMLETAENPQVVPAPVQGDTMQALRQWRDVRHDEITRQLTPGLQPDLQADFLHEVRLRLADVWRREPVGLAARVVAASAGLQAALDATPTAGPQVQGASAAAAAQTPQPTAAPFTPMHYSMMPIAASLPMSPVVVARRAPRAPSH